MEDESEFKPRPYVKKEGRGCVGWAKKMKVLLHARVVAGRFFSKSKISIIKERVNRREQYHPRVYRNSFYTHDGKSKTMYLVDSVYMKVNRLFTFSQSEVYPDKWTIVCSVWPSHRLPVSGGVNPSNEGAAVI